MKIVCPNCSTTYDVGATSIAPSGRDVRCSRCGLTWHIDPETIPETEDVSQSEDEAVDWDAAFAEADDDDDDGNGADDEDDGNLAFVRALDEDDADEGSSDNKGEREALESDPNWAFVGDEDEESDDDAGEDDDADDWQNEIGLTARDEDLASDDDLSETTADADEPVLSVEEAVKSERWWRRRKKATRDAPGYRVSRQMRAAMGLALFAGSIVLGVAIVTLREPIVRMSPNLAELYAKVGLEVNLRGLEFRDLRTFREYDKGAPVLIVEGTVENVRNTSAHVPAIRLSLRSGDAQEIYAWTVEPRQLWLRAGQTLRFSTRLASPPDVAADVLLRFTDRTRRQTDI
ncbi:zinc-ribbon domain-containing protein [Breoghania sp.]|uniref:zinc-ribbon domain-containing protein n=1 Tax=Breoghania sp. TaxID=2065378 RepID=UPI002AAAF020|nr:zinc-ribbon domain-containing protein [Breoghania sp.]